MNNNINFYFMNIFYCTIIGGCVLVIHKIKMIKLKIYFIIVKMLSTTESETKLEFVPGVFIGDRGVDFKNLIKGLLKGSNISEKYVNILTSEDNLQVYSAVFTSDMLDDNNNYQIYEQLGDLSCNKFIVWYIYNRFPQLKTLEGIKIAARVRINYGSKQCFSDIADKLNFWNFISAPNDLRQRNKKSLLEDVFEAFIGATEYILDNHLGIGVGYACVYNILESIFDKIEISLRYQDLYDAKTRLKELFDYKLHELGPFIYEETKDKLINISRVYRLKGATYETTKEGKINTSKIIGPYDKELIGEGKSNLKSSAQQYAAKNALYNLRNQGIFKPIPEIFKRINGFKIDTEIDRRYNRDTINNMVRVKTKSKFEYNYMCTPVNIMCRQRNYNGIKQCIKLGCDPNLLDTYGLTAFDNLLIGNKNQKLISKCLEKFEKVNIHRSIYKTYLSNYDITKFYHKINILE